MADLKISEMTPAAELTGAELIECVQGGVNVKQELTGLKTWVNNGVQPSSSTLDALSSFNTNGIMVQTDTSEFIGRTITGTASQVTVTNGDGVAGNPTISLAASGVTAGTYGSSSAIPVPVVDTYGRITGITTAAVVSPTVFSDSAFRIQDNDDATKQLAFEVSGVAASTARTITMPNANINLGNLSSVATTDSNTLSGTRCRIVGGSGNNVSGTDNVLINCTGVILSTSTSTTMIDSEWSILGEPANVIAIGVKNYHLLTQPLSNTVVIGSANNADLFTYPVAAATTVNSLFASSDSVPVSGTLYASLDGSQTLSAANCLQTPVSSGTVQYEVDFIVSVGTVGLASTACNATGCIVMRRIFTVFRLNALTAFISAVDTVGTDRTLGTIAGTFTPTIALSGATHVTVGITRAGGVAGQEAMAISARVRSHLTR